MHTVKFDITDNAGQRTTLKRAAETRRIDAPDAPPAGTRCKVVFEHGDRSLSFFAHAAAGGYTLTDDPADIRYEVTRFLEGLPEPAGAEPSPPAPQSVSALQAGAAEDEAAGSTADSSAAASADAPVDESVPDEEELSRMQNELGASNPLLVELKKIQKLSVVQKIRLAEEGDLTQRTLLYRMYGKLVFDGLLRNPRLTEMEVARLAKLGTLSQQHVQTIARKIEWLRNERIRNALLANPRVPPPIIQKIVSMLAKHELRPLLQRRDLPPPVQQAIRDANLKKG